MWKRMRRMIACILAGAFAVQTLEVGNLSLAVQADTEVRVDVNEQIVNAASAYLGCGYSNVSRLGPTSFDCSGLVSTVLADCGFGGIPQTTADWVNQLSSQSLSMYYGDTALETVYCSSAAAYAKAIQDSANVGKLVVLNTTVSWTDLASAGGLQPGTICVNPAESAGAYGHASIIAGQFDYSGTVKNYEAFSDSQVQYENQVVAAMKARYSLFSARSTLGLTAYPAYVTTAHSQIQAVASSAGTGSHSAAIGAIVVKEAGGTDASGTGRMGSNIWRIDSANVDEGVRLSNTIGGKTGNIATFALTYVTSGETYARLGTVKTDQAGNRIAGAVYAVFSPTSKYATGAQIAARVAKIVQNNTGLSDRKKAMESSFPDVVYMTASTSGNGYSDIIECEDGAQTIERCVVELYAPSDYLRDDAVYQIRVKTTADATGLGCKLQQVTVLQAGSLGTNLNIKAAGSATVLPVLSATDYTYYGKVGFQKLDPAGTKISGVVYAMIPTTQSDAVGVLADLKKAYGTPAFDGMCTALSGEIIFKCKTSGTDSGTIRMGTKSSISYYLQEMYAPVGYAVDTNIYKVTVTGVKTNTTGEGSTAKLTLYQGENAQITLASDGDSLEAVDHPYYISYRLQKLDAEDGTTPVGPAGYVMFRDKEQMLEFIADRDKYLAEHPDADRTEIYTALLNHGQERTYMAATTLGKQGSNTTSHKVTASNSDVDANGVCHGYLVEYAAAEGYELDPGYSYITFQAGVEADGSDSQITEIRYYAEADATAYEKRECLADGSIPLYENAAWYARLALMKQDAVTEDGVVADYAIYGSYEDMLSALENKASGQTDGDTTDSVDSGKALCTLNLKGEVTVSDILQLTLQNSDIDKTSGRLHLYVLELDVADGYVAESGYHELLVQAVKSSDGTGTAILSATYYETINERSGGRDQSSQIQDNTLISGKAQYQILEQPIALVGAFAVQKVDTDGKILPMAGLQFGIYAEADCENLLATIETDGQGLATYELDQWYAPAGREKTYYVQEIAESVPEDYTANPDIYAVTVTGSETAVEDCQVRAVNMTTRAVSDSITFLLPNEKRDRYAVLGLNKVDQTTSAYVGNAIYRLVTEAGADKIVAGDEVETSEILAEFTTAQDGSLTYSPVLATGKEDTLTVYLYEAEAPEGYLCDEHVYRITLNSSVQKDGTGSSIAEAKVWSEEEKCWTQIDQNAGLGILQTGSGAGLPAVTMSDKPEPKYYGKLQIRKTDTYELLNNISYGIYSDENCSQLIAKIQTGTDGEAEYELTPWLSSKGQEQVIYLKELETDPCHVLDQQVYECRIYGSLESAEKCQVEWTALKDDTESALTVDGNTLVLVNLPSHVTFQKIAYSGGQPVYEAGETGPVVGAWLQIIDEAGNVVYEYATDGKNLELIGVLQVGKTYTLHELSAPEGYQLAEDVTFTVSRDGSIDAVIMGDEVIYGRVRIHKTTDGGESLAGVEFAILSEGKTVETITTDENGCALSSLLPRYAHQADGSLTEIAYTVQEVRTVDGCVLSEDVVDVVFETEPEQNADGKWQVSAPIEWVNDLQEGSLSITKVNEADHPLSGVRFSLTCMDTSKEYELITDGNGYASLQNLPIGRVVEGQIVPFTYELREVEAAAGYERCDRVETFSFFTEDGVNLEAAYRYVNQARPELPLTGTSGSGIPGEQAGGILGEQAGGIPGEQAGGILGEQLSGLIGEQTGDISSDSLIPQRAELPVGMAVCIWLSGENHERKNTKNNKRSANRRSHHIA